MRCKEKEVLSTETIYYYQVVSIRGIICNYHLQTLVNIPR